ncbi:major facilitator superfamily protein [Hyphomicrobium denitrificans 1NES1]|uniref:Major facilitator superfamily protein n=1 Tax=Hyphomicrobium denitrificans 1NES1 TaxID=670307 RepID=N0B168_9HYPH|nr:major facilitator superfamily protein [Hyphomicrobium denitrificans 1NES1]
MESGVRPLSFGLILTMAIACGVAVANIYYNQPMLGVIKREFAGSWWVGLIPTATQIGYGLGLFLLVPLGDLMDRRRLIVGQFLLLGVASFAASLAPNAAALVAASLVVGACASVAQQIIPFAASLAAPDKRGSTIGTVMAGLLCGILLSRLLSGVVATYAGWREMFQLGLPISVGGAIAMAIALPRNYPHSGLRYTEALKSLVHLWVAESSLRRASLMQAAMFASFSAFWTILALHLEEPNFNLGADAAGLFGVVGAVGVVAAPLAGRLADRRGSELVLCFGAGLVVVSWLLFGVWDHLAGLVAGVIIMDIGAQGALISNQHMIYALRPEARSRLNTVFMTTMFVGGAFGSIGGIVAWESGGWLAVCGFGAALALAALSLQMFDRAVASDAR